MGAERPLHGGGIEGVPVGRVDGRIVCEITDGGEGFDFRPLSRARR